MVKELHVSVLCVVYYVALSLYTLFCLIVIFAGAVFFVSYPTSMSGLAVPDKNPERSRSVDSWRDQLCIVFGVLAATSVSLGLI